MLADFSDAQPRRRKFCETAHGRRVIANEICERARTADLVVIGPPGNQREVLDGPPRGNRRERHAQVARSRSSLSDGMERRNQEAALAYDGSQRSASAMQAAADFAYRSASLAVVHVARDEAKRLHAARQAKRYLAVDRSDLLRTLSGHAPNRSSRDSIGRPRIPDHRRLRSQPNRRDGPRQHDRVRATNAPARCS